MAFTLPTLPPTQPEWAQFQIWWQQIVERIEAQEARQDDLLAQVIAAQAAAAAAATDAAAAQSTADDVRRDDAIADSYTVPGAALSAADAGSDATITIAAHDRVYNDGLVKPVNGGSLTGLAYTTSYYVYYDDPTRAGGAVTYQVTTDAKTALPASATGRHYTGHITTPGAGGGGTTGGTPPPSGGGGIPPDNVV